MSTGFTVPIYDLAVKDSFWTGGTIRCSQLNVQLSVDIYHDPGRAHPLVTLSGNTEEIK